MKSAPTVVCSTRSLPVWRAKAWKSRTEPASVETTRSSSPLPILKAKKALADMATGDVLKIVATDPGSVRDFQAFARQTGNELVEQTSANDEFVHYLRRR